MTQLPEVSDIVRNLSAYQTKFLQFVDRNPQCLEAETFKQLARPESGWKAKNFLSHHVPIQPWPMFLDAESFAKFGEIALKSFELVRSLPERFFKNDARRLCDFYALDEAYAETLVKALALPWRPGRELMRGDFLLCSGQLKCIEINATANAGGIFNFQVAEACLQVPILQRFLEQQKVSARFRDPWRTLLLTMIEHATARGLHSKGRLNLGILIKWPEEYLSTTAIIEPPFRVLLAKYAPGTEGKIIFCHFEDLQRDGDVFKAKGEPVQILMQFRGAVPTVPIGLEIEAWIDGIIDLYPGPLNWIYSDKRNLALLSAHAETPGLFSAEEATWIDQHLPWSRVVQPGPTTWEGQRQPLERLLLSRREELVLKPAQSLGGVGVQVGCKTSPEKWEALVATALEYVGTYLAQEYLREDLQLQQWGEQGCVPCSINWGLFTAGNRFGGIYLRSCPPPDSGVVNVTNGALDSCALELISPLEASEDSDIEFVRTY